MQKISQHLCLKKSYKLSPKDKPANVNSIEIQAALSDEEKPHPIYKIF